MPPEYFLDEMTSTEVHAILHNQNEHYKNTWEQVRYISFVTAALQNDKIQNPIDLIKFSWEIEDKDKPISREERIQREQELLDRYKSMSTSQS